MQEIFGLKVLEVLKIMEEDKKILDCKVEADDPKKCKKIIEDETEVFVKTALETQAQD